MGDLFVPMLGISFKGHFEVFSKNWLRVGLNFSLNLKLIPQDVTKIGNNNTTVLSFSLNFFKFIIKLNLVKAMFIAVIY